MKRFGVVLLLMATVASWAALAAERVVWVGPIYVELAESLNRGFRQYYQRTFGKDIEVVFIRPGGWPVCVDKVRLWGGKPEADVFLGAGAPAHNLLRELGLIVPYKPADWDKIPLEWKGMLNKDPDGYWTPFSLWLVTNIYNEEVLKMYNLPVPRTWEDLLNPVYRGLIVETLPYASGTQHEVVEIILQTMGEEAGWAYNRYLAAQLLRFSTGSVDTLHIVSRGEAAIGVAQPQMNAMAARRDGYPVVALIPDKTILVPESAALLAGAPNEQNAKIFLDWLYSVEGQRYVLEGAYFPARPDVSFSAWAAEGVAMARHAMAALGGVDNFYDQDVELILYDLDLATKRWDDVNRYFETEIYRRLDELKETLTTIEAVEKEIAAARAQGRSVAQAEARIAEARRLWERGQYREGADRAREARALIGK